MEQGSNLCIAGLSGGLSKCGGKDCAERGRCEFFFPAGPWSDDCMHHRDDLQGHCDNANAQHAARNGG